MGRSAGGVSPQEIRAARDRLAPRADCYERPDIACLSQFTSVEYASGEPSNDPAVTARTQVCSSGFEAADKALAPIAINAPRYRAELVQVAYAGTGCSRPADAIAALRAASGTLDASPAEKASFLLSILNTDDLNVGWPFAAGELDQLLQTDGLDKSMSASVALALALRAARDGNSEEAHAKARYVIDTLGFDINVTERQAIAAALVMDGEFDEAFALAPHKNISELFSFWSLDAAGRQLATFDNEAGRGWNSVYELYAANDQNLGRMLEAPEGDRDVLAALQAVEAKLDGLLERPGQAISRSEPTRLTELYSILAFGYERIGRPQAADATMAKAAAIGSPTAEAAAMIAVNRGDYASAAELLGSIGYRLQIVPLLEHIASTGDAGTALDIASRVGGNQEHNQAAIVRSLTAHGYNDLAHQVLVSMPIQSSERLALAWELADAMATTGKTTELEKIVSEFSLEQGGYRYPLLVPLARARAHAENGDRKSAVEALEAALLVGQKMDADAGENSLGRRANVHEAEEAASLAFELGYTDLAFDLYQRAEYKSFRPLQIAMQHMEGANAYKRILLAANDGLDEEEESYVVNHLVNKMTEE
ncbi:MAG: hypothetical protein KDA53_03695 [Hyphomonas sp.]|nr:hypothetical protein [Hyphomonas sp.]